MPAVVDEEGNLWHKEEERQRQLMIGVEGAHLCIPFQCELCWFRNIERRDPVPGRDDLYLTCIRRANLDAMLGKSPLTIRAHRRETLAALENAASIGKTPAYHPRCPFPMSDEVGMSLAVDMLLKSLRAKGRILDHVQYATLRKMRGTYTKNWESSPAGIREGAAFANGNYRVRQTSCPAQSEWFHDFSRGLEYRMGCQSDPDHGLIIGAIVHVLALIKADAEEAENEGLTLDANEMWKVGAYICFLTTGSLRGHEGFYVELAGLRSHVLKGRLGDIPRILNKSTLLSEEQCRNLPYVTLCLLGKFKGEIGTDHHMIVVANETVSGLKPRWWVEKLISVCESEGRTRGPAGNLALSVDYNSMLRKYLKRVQEETSLIPIDQDVEARYSTSRTPRKTAVTRLERAGFGGEFVDRVNRWRGQEQSKGRYVRRRMNAHYADAMLMAPTTWLGSYFL
jgi:hypothetical protein